MLGAVLFGKGYSGELDSGKPDVAGLVPDHEVTEETGAAVGPDGELAFDKENGAIVDEINCDWLIGAVPMLELACSALGDVWNSDETTLPGVPDGRPDDADSVDVLDMAYGADDPETVVTELLRAVMALTLAVELTEEAVVLTTGREVTIPVGDATAEDVTLRLLKRGDAVGPTIGEVLFGAENGGADSGVEAPGPGVPLAVSPLLGPFPVGPGVALEFDIE